MISQRSKTRLAALGMAAASFIGLVGCDLGTSTPTPLPTNTPAAQATATLQPPSPTIEQPTASPTTGETATPATSEVTSTPEGQAEASPTAGGSQGGVTPSNRPPDLFAAYNLPDTSVSPSLKPYTVQPGLANVANAGDFQLSPAAKALIEQNLFAAQFPAGDQYKQFYQLYEDGRYSQKPVLYQPNSLLHVYHLFFDKLLRDTETKYLICDCQGVDGGAAQDRAGAVQRFEGHPGGDRGQTQPCILRRSPEVDRPDLRHTLGGEQRSHTGIEPDTAARGASPVCGYGYWGQRIYRGVRPVRAAGALHALGGSAAVLQDDDVVWADDVPAEERGRDPLGPADDDGAGATNQVGAARSDIWDAIYEPTSFFVGTSDDLTYPRLRAA